MRISLFKFSLVLLMPFHDSQVQLQSISSRASFRGLCAVNDQVAWVSGTQGTVARTVDGGKTWEVMTVAETDKLDFRDVEAFSETTAYVLSIGPGEKSRIYKTVNGGKTWKLQFKNTDPDAFYDAMAFWDASNGIAISDPVNGYYRLIGTTDGGESWKPLPFEKMPRANAGDGAFAASGTCLITNGTRDAWFVTGGGPVARMFHSTDRGQSWSAHETPILAGKPSAGIFSIAFKDINHGMIVGGDYQQPNDKEKTTAVTTDGGKTWQLVSHQLPFRSAVVWSKGRWLAAGTSGISQTSDALEEWKLLDEGNFHAIRTSSTGKVWAAGPEGRVAIVK